MSRKAKREREKELPRSRRKGKKKMAMIPFGVGTKRQPRLRATDAKHETMNLIRCRGTPVCSTRRSSHWKLGKWWSRSTIFGIGKERFRRKFDVDVDVWRPLID